jgi:hypothetical protein
MDIGEQLDTMATFIANIESYGLINEEEADKLIEFYTDKLVAETIVKLEKGETDICKVLTDILK